MVFFLFVSFSDPVLDTFLLPPMFKIEIFGLASSTAEYLETKGEANITLDSIPTGDGGELF
jgi:hypothetical protein